MVSQKVQHTLMILVIAALVLTACNPRAISTPQPTPMPEETSPTQAESSQETLLPSPLPKTEYLYLIGAQGTDASTTEQIEQYLKQRAASAGFEFVSSDDFPQGEVDGILRIAVILNADENIRELAAANRQTQFVVFSGMDIQPAENLNVIRQSAGVQAFLAGFIAVLVASDYRAGALLADDTFALDRIQDAYANGARYLCGRCTPVYGPIVAFPQMAVIPASSPSDAWQAAFDQLHQNRIQSLLLSPQGAQAQFLTYLAGLNVSVLGFQPPPEGFSSNWITTIQFDAVAALDQLWPELTSGAGGRAFSAPIRLNDINENLLTPGKLIMVEQVMNDLQEGWIYPFTVSE